MDAVHELIGILPDTADLLTFGLDSVAFVTLLDLIHGDLGEDTVAALGEHAGGERHGNAIVDLEDIVLGQGDAGFLLGFLDQECDRAEVHVEAPGDELGDRAVGVLLGLHGGALLVDQEDTVVGGVVEQADHAVRGDHHDGREALVGDVELEEGHEALEGGFGDCRTPGGEHGGGAGHLCFSLKGLPLASWGEEDLLVRTMERGEYWTVCLYYSPERYSLRNLLSRFQENSVF